MGEIQQFLLSLFVIDTIWSVMARGIFWLVIAVIIILNSNPTQDPDKTAKKLKTNLGFFLLFICLSSGLLFLLFGYSPQP